MEKNLPLEKSSVGAAYLTLILIFVQRRFKKFWQDKKFSNFPGVYYYAVYQQFKITKSFA